MLLLILISYAAELYRSCGGNCPDPLAVFGQGDTGGGPADTGKPVCEDFSQAGNVKASDYKKAHSAPAALPVYDRTILTFPHAVLHEASITFLGFGLPPEEPSVGMILSESMRYLIAGKWWMALFPGLALTGTVLLFESMGRQWSRKRRIWR